MYHYHHYDDNYHDHHHPHDHQPQPWLTRTDWCEHKSDWPSRRSVCSTGILHPASQAWTAAEFSPNFPRDQTFPGAVGFPQSGQNFSRNPKTLSRNPKDFSRGCWLFKRWKLERERIEFGIEVKWALREASIEKYPAQKVPYCSVLSSSFSFSSLLVFSSRFSSVKTYIEQEGRQRCCWKERK